MVEQQQRWATPDSTIRLQKSLIDDQTIEADDRGHLRRLKRRGRRIKALVLVSLLGVFALIGLAVVFDHYYIPGTAMEPTISAGDRVISNQFSYRFGDVSRGDVVVFESREPEGSASFDAIQRVIGLPGESIEIIDGIIFIDGSQLNEPYLDSTHAEQMPAIQIPADHYFLMGDNREGSRDSRDLGPVPSSDIKARAFRTFWPFDRQTSL